MGIFTVLSWVIWVLFVFGAVFTSNYVRIGDKPIRSPVLRGLMAVVALPVIGGVFYIVGSFFLLAPTSLFAH